MSLREPPAGDAPARGGATTAGRGAAGTAPGRLAGHPLAGHPLAWPGLAGLALGLLAVGPGLAPGYILSYDMVFAPRMPVTAATLGLAGGPPRAVPSDAILAVLGAVVPADLAQKVILVGIFAAACTGAARLLAHCAARAGRAAPLAGRLAAGVLYAWNPYLAERLIIGHWALLLGYAALPWVVAAVGARAGPSAAPTLAVASRSGRPYAVIGPRRKGRTLIATDLPVDLQEVRSRSRCLAGGARGLDGAGGAAPGGRGCWRRGCWRRRWCRRRRAGSRQSASARWRRCRWRWPERAGDGRGCGD